MEHSRKELRELQEEAREFSDLFNPAALDEQKNLLRAIELQPEHSVLWQRLLSYNDLDLIDKATCYHLKNYTAWAVRRRLNVPPVRDLALLQKAFKTDQRNFHAINYLRFRLEELDDSDDDSEAVQQLREMARKLRQSLAKSSDLTSLKRNLLIYPDDVDLWSHWFNCGGEESYCLEVCEAIEKQHNEGIVYGPRIAFARRRVGECISANISAEEVKCCAGVLDEIPAESEGRYMARFLQNEIERITHE